MAPEYIDFLHQHSLVLDFSKAYIATNPVSPAKPAVVPVTDCTVSAVLPIYEATRMTVPCALLPMVEQYQDLFRTTPEAACNSLHPHNR